MPLGMVRNGFAQYDLAGHTGSTPTLPRNHTAFAPAWLEIGRSSATMPSMALNRNYKLRLSNGARFMVHASNNFLHVTRNKLRHRHHLARISMCNTLLALRVLGVERPRRTLGVLVPISAGSRVLSQDHGSQVLSRAGRYHSNRQSANNLLSANCTLHTCLCRRTPS